jgi:hypothetical protein
MGFRTPRNSLESVLTYAASDGFESRLTAEVDYEENKNGNMNRKVYYVNENTANV